MKLLNSMITVVLLLSTTFIFGQDNSNTKNEIPFIEVTGTAEMNIIPDEIFISISIREKFDNKKKITVEEQEEKLKSALKNIGVDLKNLYLNDLNAGFVKFRYKKAEVITQKDYTLMVNSAEVAGKVFEELDKLEIMDAEISKVDHSQMENLRQEVKIKAIKAAKNKADYLLNAIGEQTGKPLIIRENEISIYRPISTSNSILNVNNLSVNDVQEEKALEFSKIKIQASFYVKFSIK